MKLYNYYRSSASYRVRIGLALKGLDYDYVSVHLLKGEQLSPTYRHLSAAGLVPVLEDGGHAITQSLAILEYLDETRPQPALLPTEPLARARVRALALSMACEIHPLNNLRVTRYLTEQMHLAEADKDRWVHHWIETGLEAVERLLEQHPATGRYCHGDTPGLADVLLVPQVYNARRFGCRLDHVPTVVRIEQACLELDAFRRTQPSACPDAPAEAA